MMEPIKGVNRMMAPDPIADHLNTSPVSILDDSGRPILDKNDLVNEFERIRQDRIAQAFIQNFLYREKQRKLKMPQKRKAKARNRVKNAMAKKSRKRNRR